MNHFQIYFLMPLFLCLLALGGFSTPAFAQAGNCQPLATLFDEPICPETLKQDLPVNNILGGENQQPAVPKAENTPPAPQALRSEIWRLALQRKYGAEAFTLEEKEIASFRKIFKSETDRSYETDRLTAALLEAYLNDNLYADSHRQQIEQLLRATEVSIASFEKKKEHEHSVPDHLQFIADEVEKAVASQMLQSWKEDKVLFEDYGGRLIRLPGKLIPIDAYREFYGYIQKEGQLSIHHPGFQNIFSELERDAFPEHVAEESELYKNYFTDASWQFRITADRERLVILEDWLKSLPIAKKVGEP